jgi:hypothetical protein
VDLNFEKKQQTLPLFVLKCNLHSTLIVNIRFEAGKTSLSAIHSTVRGNLYVIDGINQILLLSGGTNKHRFVK